MIRRSVGLLALSLLVLSTGSQAQVDPSEALYRAIRNDDLASIRTLVDEAGVDLRDSRGQTPLILASAFGSLEAMEWLIDRGAEVNAASASGITALHLAVGDAGKVRLLIDHGADIHARTLMGRTPLLVAASSSGSSETVRVLVEAGADVNAADVPGVTPLIAAAANDDIVSARFLVEHGADAQARGEIPTSATPLIGAASNGNAELVRLLLDAGASVNEFSSPPSAAVRNGIVQFGSQPPLHLAVLSDNADVVRMLLDRGADVNALESRDMTPLMVAVSTDPPNVEIVRLLIDAGADPSIRSGFSETTWDWARKFNHPEVLTALELDRVSRTSSSGAPGGTSTRRAVAQSVPLLEESSRRMLTDGGCVACHAQPITHVALAAATDRGWINEDAYLEESLEVIRTRWMNADQPMLQGFDPGGAPETMLYSTWALAEADEPATRNTDVLVHYLLAKQREDGTWHGTGASRAPIQDGRFSRTALAIRTLAAYGTPSREAEIEESLRRAADWLASADPESTEDRVMQILGLVWADRAPGAVESRARQLLASEREGGGWSQTPYLESDAYATGQVLYALARAGIGSNNDAVRRGVDFLLRTQKNDGTWYVPSRAMKIQPYFESGFPYEDDQWISSMGTAWAVLGLSSAGEDREVAMLAIDPTRFP